MRKAPGSPTRKAFLTSNTCPVFSGFMTVSEKGLLVSAASQTQDLGPKISLLGLRSTADGRPREVTLIGMLSLRLRGPFPPRVAVFDFSSITKQKLTVHVFTVPCKKRVPPAASQKHHGRREKYQFQVPFTRGCSHNGKKLVFTLCLSYPSSSSPLGLPTPGKLNPQSQIPIYHFFSSAK
ncbi:hypothetical protein QQP08_019533 [Theobroma cacao]|nr:hypothetical protein QQP08_019533 [Theobroma cacao]